MMPASTAFLKASQILRKAGKSDREEACFLSLSPPSCYPITPEGNPFARRLLHSPAFNVPQQYVELLTILIVSLTIFLSLTHARSFARGLFLPVLSLRGQEEKKKRKREKGAPGSFDSRRS